MNLVSLLIAPAVITYSIGDDKNVGVRVTMALVAALVIVGAVVFSKRKEVAMGDSADGSGGAGTGAPDTKPETVNA
jgi:K(+)-stimulated pyrophosphate-energized sodium pump